ncbi:MAG: hypothetical protein CMN79_01250 [Spirochaetales bacterium]|jgi:chorismate dehydratase|nr:hypothetical protein [Spirochaetales bacterium]|tara:strand:- start:3623 stop:4423 length:801 start_codon:yes stop_codon:yes gene_type:complete
MIKYLGTVPFLNSKPLTYLFDNNSFENYKTSEYYPSSLLDPLVSGEVFLSLLPIADHLSGESVISLTDYCISSYGKVDSVLLVSKSKLKDIKTVVLDSRSKSSNMLFKTLQSHFLNIDVDYEVREPKLNMKMKPDVGYVTIGDLSLEIISSNPIGVNTYDLGEIWFNETGFPFTFGTYNYLHSSPNEEELNLLDDSYQEGSQHASLIIDDFLVMNGSKIRRKVAEKYLNERIFYKITNQHIKGINLFRDLSSKFANWKKNSFNNEV